MTKGINFQKSDFYHGLIAITLQLNQLYNSRLIDFSLTFKVGFNVLIYSALLIFLFTVFYFYNYHLGF